MVAFLQAAYRALPADYRREPCWRQRDAYCSTADGPHGMLESWSESFRRAGARPARHDPSLAACLSPFTQSARPSLTNVARLYEMQKLDSQWEKIRKRLLQLQVLTAEPEELRTARSNHAGTLHERDGQLARQRDAELEGKSLDERIRASDARLMSGSVHNPKELESLQQSVEALRRQRGQVEETALEAMMMAEELTKQGDKQAGSLSRQEQQWSHRHADLLEEEVKLKRLALQLKAQRSALVSSLPEADVTLYEDLRKRRAGIAVATIENGQCSACNVRVPTGVTSSAKSGGEAYCTSCGRLLTMAQ